MPEKLKETITQENTHWQKQIRKLETQLYSEFKNEDFGISDPNSANIYFAPTVHFKKNLITRTDIKNFKQNPEWKMLSVGAGPGYLERLLIHLGANKNNIILADKESRDLPNGFKTEIFDMFEEWPKFKSGQFDLIIFPENPAINVGYIHWNDKIQAFTSLFKKALKYLKTGGEIRITGNPTSEEVTTEIEQGLRKAGYNVMVENFHNKGLESLIVVKNKTSPNTC